MRLYGIDCYSHLQLKCLKTIRKTEPNYKVKRLLPNMFLLHPFLLKTFWKERRMDEILLFMLHNIYFKVLLIEFLKQNMNNK